MAIVALNDRDAAEEIYADLLPHRDGPPAGAASLSLALRPVAHTLGELAHFAQASVITASGTSWTASSPARHPSLLYARRVWWREICTDLIISIIYA
ncbi:hypothetical protein OHB12_03235 [Nocardia sp. NBC_01730]|uniref:hypothetical protein n=1 Tax=Nocardia sp. NBC_01730 TaxID=2975998 RepID=UPI002E15A2F7|nr:hypothetical protein OHB12_03235 [Nocardia sp. NBC_01730]